MRCKLGLAALLAEQPQTGDRFGNLPSTVQQSRSQRLTSSRGQASRQIWFLSPTDEAWPGKDVTMETTAKMTWLLIVIVVLVSPRAMGKDKWEAATRKTFGI